MSTIFANHHITGQGQLLPSTAFFSSIHEKWGLDGLTKRYGDAFIARAEKDLDTPYPMLTATLHLDFTRNGDRSRFEGVYFKRREMLWNFAMAELAEGKGRFTDRIIDGAWQILEESSWVISAHSRSCKGTENQHVNLPNTFFTSDEDDDVKFIDLFAAYTGAMMAILYTVLGKVLDPEVPVIRHRMRSQLHHRILHPYYTYDDNWWMGAGGGALNNWTPWIVSNVLLVVALCEEDDAAREAAVAKSIVILDRFTRHYPSDGGCDEGPGYWGAAGASYFDCLELLYDMSGGKIDVFSDELVRRMCAYIMNFRISGTRFINFADASSRCGVNYRLVARMARRLGDDRLAAFARSVPGDRNSFTSSTWMSYRLLRDLGEDVPYDPAFVPAEKIWYDGLQVAITRHPESGMFLALKGGTNGESHNHNDVGQFILFDGEEPVILDAGVEQYSRITFSPQRYTLWAMRSAYHNIPEISGCEQKPGRQYHADTLAYEEATGALTLELKNAYPAEANIESYQRSARLEGSTALITDSLILREAGDVVFHYILADEVVIEGNTIRFATGHTATFDPTLVASVDKIDLENGKIGREWKREFLYRLNLAAPTPVTEASYTLRIEKNP